MSIKDDEYLLGFNEKLLDMYKCNATHLQCT